LTLKIIVLEVAFLHSTRFEVVFTIPLEGVVFEITFVAFIESGVYSFAVHNSFFGIRVDLLFSSITGTILKYKMV